MFRGGSELDPGTFPFGDLDALEKLLVDETAPLAAVVLEPPPDVPGARVPGRCGGDGPHPRRAGGVRRGDRRFRLAPGGARERYAMRNPTSRVTAALGNGMPIAAGRRSVGRDGGVRGSLRTHGGEALSLAAAAAVLDTVADGTVLAGIESLGADLMVGMAARIEDARPVTGCRSRERQRTVVSFGGDEPLLDKSWVQQCFAQGGVLFNGSMFISVTPPTTSLGRSTPS